MNDILVLVAYDINIPDSTPKPKVKWESEWAQDRREKIENVIRRYPNRQLSESAYAVQVPDPILLFVQELFHLVAKQDSIYVTPLPGPVYAPSSQPADVQTWFEHLPLVRRGR
jgi:hypothetical protein